MAQRPLYPLSLKPDLAQAARRWEAYFAGDIIDRPLVQVTAPRPGKIVPPQRGYRQKVFGDIDSTIDAALERAGATYWCGEAVPAFFISFGPDEISVFCGAELRWSEDSGDTNWSSPCIGAWADALPLRLQEEHPLWQRMLRLYRCAADRLAGKMLIQEPDLHTNMDLLAAMRGPQQLCLDLLDEPETIDRAMADARAVFPKLWDAVTQAGDMYQRGFCHGHYSMNGAAMLQCDFSAMIGPAMFRRWVLPALEEEAALVGHAYYHWDGPDAVKHLPDLLASKGLHTLSYVPGDGRGSPIGYIELYRRVQAGGKAVHVWGTPDELKVLHRALRPEKTMYSTSVDSIGEADALLDWFTRHT